MRWLTLVFVMISATAQPNASTLCCTLVMSDSWGDGWGGTTLEITDKNGTAVVSGLTVEYATVTYRTITQSEVVCMARDAAPFTVTLRDLDATCCPLTEARR